jgi:hypothetical protein
MYGQNNGQRTERQSIGHKKYIQKTKDRTTRPITKTEMDLERNLPFIIIFVVPSYKKIEHKGNFTNFLREQKEDMS